MLIKLSEILKQQGLFSQDIKARFKNKQMSINGESISEDVDINCSIVSGKVETIDVGDFLFGIISNKDWALKIHIFGFENLFDTNIENNLTLFLKNFIFLKTSKKQILILKREI